MFEIGLTKEDAFIQFYDESFQQANTLSMQLQLQRRFCGFPRIFNATINEEF
jgi:hypothetical protein